jgi:hypothetical protein
MANHFSDVYFILFQKIELEMKKNFVLVDNFYSTPREGFSSHCEIKNT